MFWETVAAIFLLFATLPFWIVAALGWGLLRAAYVLIVALYGAATSAEPNLADFAASPFLAVLSGIEAAWSVPAGIWTWAKYEHPWWATGIAVIVLTFTGGSSKR